MIALDFVQRRSAQAALLFLWLTFVSACMYSPTNGETLSSTSSPVTFRGYALAASRPVEIWGAATRDGRYFPFAFGVSSDRATTFPDGTKLYAFEITKQVPWWSSTCTNQEAFVKAVVDRGELYTFDVVNGAGKTPRQCLSDAVGAGRGTVQAVLDCKSPESPVVRIQVAGSPLPVSHSGSLSIENAAQAAQYRCLQSVSGDFIVNELTVDADFPNLRTISGSAILQYGVPPAPDGQVVPLRRITLPALTSVGGRVSLVTYARSGQQFIGDLGLSALTAVGNDVQVSARGALRLTGLSRVTSLPQNLRVDATDANLSILGSLRAVNGNVELSLSRSTMALRALRTVGGNFRFFGGPIEDRFLSLESVSGNLELAAAFSPNSTQGVAFPWLTRVGRQLILRYWYSGLGVVVPPDAALGGLYIVGSHANSLQGVMFNVNPTGTIRFSHNMSLCRSEIEAWLDQLPGWSGPREVPDTNADC